MLTIKFCAGKRGLLPLILAAAVLAGCGAPGPRALLVGKKLIEKQRYADALLKLETATKLIPTNALAWNYLGLAQHHLGRVTEAEAAYRRALSLNPDLNEVHYNRGCLWLEHNRFDEARTELVAYTLREAKNPEAWIRLGTAQTRLREFSAAERSFSEALRITNTEPAALTGLGLVRVQRGFPRDAVAHFNNAIKAQTNYAPAILNLAIVAQEQLRDRNLALQKYKDYLALQPPPANADGVRALVRQLEQEMAPSSSARPVQTVAPPTRPTPEAPSGKPFAAEPAKSPTPKTAATSPATAKGADIVAAAPKPTTTPPAAPAHAASAPATAGVEVVRLAAEPVFKPGDDVTVPAPTTSVTSRTATPNSAPPKPVASQSAESKSPKRGFLQKINPLSLFAGEGKSPPRPTPLPPQEPASAGSASTGVTSLQPTGSRVPRYVYRSPSRPAAGNRGEAERAFAQGVQAQQAQRLPEALQAYRRAIQLDPSFFDAQYNLGLAATQASNTQMALTAYESALAIRPDSLDARYNFALLLKAANYPLDAVNELERILARFPNDSRSHLALGNLYAQQLRQPAQARKHYLRVLETDPRNPQAAAVRYWLTDNP